MEEENKEAKLEEKTPSEPAKTTASSEPETSGIKADAQTSSGLEPNLAALLAYLFGWIGGLIFYFIETKNKYIRFHALQSILLSVGLIAALMVLGVVTSVFSAMGLGLIMWPIAALLNGVIWIGFLVISIMLMVKAYQGEKWVLPIIGDIAEKNS